MLGYIGLNATISARAVTVTRPLVERVAEPRMIVAAEVPLTFWKRRDGLASRRDRRRRATTIRSKASTTRRLDPEIVVAALDDPRLAAAAKRDKHVRAFLFWSRMPMVVSSRTDAPF